MLYANAGLLDCLCSGVIQQRRFCGACAYVLSSLTPFWPLGYKCWGKTISTLSACLSRINGTNVFLLVSPPFHFFVS